MRVKITRPPRGIVQGVLLNRFRMGEVYDLAPALAEYLVVENYAILEMREAERPAVPVEVERRRRS